MTIYIGIMLKIVGMEGEDTGIDFSYVWEQINCNDQICSRNDEGRRDRSLAAGCL